LEWTRNGYHSSFKNIRFKAFSDDYENYEQHLIIKGTVVNFKLSLSNYKTIATETDENLSGRNKALFEDLRINDKLRKTDIILLDFGHKLFGKFRDKTTVQTISNKGMPTYYIELNPFEFQGFPDYELKSYLEILEKIPQGSFLGVYLNKA